MKLSREKEKEDLKVEFSEVGSGWMYFKVKTGQQVFNGRFSAVLDPIEDLKHWLEAISIGVEQTSFHYDAEGYYIKFDFKFDSWGYEVLTISDPFENGETFIVSNIKRRQIVSAFYYGLLNFIFSDKFQKTEWEIEYLKERHCKLLKTDEENLILQLSQLDKESLGAFLSNANSLYNTLDTETLNKVEDWRFSIADIIGEMHIANESKQLETPTDWKIPSNYSTWTNVEKRDFVIKCINETTYGYGGMKLDNFRSLIIEKYLTEH